MSLNTRLCRKCGGRAQINRDFTPEIGLDPRTLEYQCEDCQETVYITPGSSDPLDRSLEQGAVQPFLPYPQAKKIINSGT